MAEPSWTAVQKYIDTDNYKLTIVIVWISALVQISEISKKKLISIKVKR